MLGRPILNKFFIFLICCVFAAPAESSAQQSIAILLSDSEDAYSIPAASFEEAAMLPVTTFNLEGNIRKKPNLKDELFQAKPALIFALGAKAAYLAKVWTKDKPDVPVIFGMVLNWKRYKLLEDQDNIAGIAAEMAPGTQFVNLTTFVPNVRKIGVIYSEEYSGEIFEDAKQAAQLLGLELVPVDIERSDDFQRAFRKISNEIDGFWVVNDPVTYSLQNMAWLAKRCIKERLVCLGQSRNITEQGIALAVNPDIYNIGTQAASMARNILLGNQSPKNIGVMAPLGTNIHVNLKTADRIGLEISHAALDMATMVFD